MSLIVQMPLEFVKSNKGGNLLVVERRLAHAVMIGAILSHARFLSVRFSARGFDGFGLTGYLYILLAMELLHSADMVSKLKRNSCRLIVHEL